MWIITRRKDLYIWQLYVSKIVYNLILNLN
jgi:hypothetical protein